MSVFSSEGIANLRKLHGLKERVRLVASGKFVTPAGVAWALCVCADFVVSARGFMFAGVSEPRRLRRYHVRIVQGNGNSVPFNQLFPSPDEADNSPIPTMTVDKTRLSLQPAPPADVPVPSQF